MCPIRAALSRDNGPEAIEEWPYCDHESCDETHSSGEFLE